MNQVLTLNDLKLIFTELHEVCDKWYGIGLELDLSVDYLEDLEANFSVDDDTCLRKVLVEWLKTRQATWASLIKVLNSDVVKGSSLAKVLQRKYSTGKSKKPTATDNNCEASTSPNSKQHNYKATKRVKKPSSLFTPKKSKVDIDLPDSFLPSDFVNVPPPDRLCVKCRRVPRVPLISKCCHRLYCEPCSSSLENTRCRKHKEVIEYDVDMNLRRKLSRLMRRCLNQSTGCEWKGDERALVQHLQSSCLQTGSPSVPTNSEVSSTNDSATTSQAPLAMFTEPVTNGKKQAVNNKNSVGQMALRNGSVERITSDGNPDYKSVVSLSPQPLCAQHSKWRRETCYLMKTPPLNLAMENVSEYIDSDETWLSDGFFSHQIGYKMCLAVRIQSSSQVDGSLNIMMGITSAEGTQSGYLLYPCSGYATLVILNPYRNTDHKVLELVFVVEKPGLNSCREIVSEVVDIPPHFITQDDCIFFRVEKIDMDKIKHKLWLLDTSFIENQQPQYENGECS